MRIKTKIAILAVAVLLTFLGFNLIASSAAVEWASSESWSKQKRQLFLQLDKRLRDGRDSFSSSDRPKALVGFGFDAYVVFS